MRTEMAIDLAGRKSTPRLHGTAQRIFVSVDTSTGRSTISFQPADVGEPILNEGDHSGTIAMRAAKAISDGHPGSTIHGPHFHGARPVGRKRAMRKAPEQGEE
jgi:hypothetical protein